MPSLKKKWNEKKLSFKKQTNKKTRVWQKKITSRRVMFWDSEINNIFKCKVVGCSKKLPVFFSAMGLCASLGRSPGLSCNRLQLEGVQKYSAKTRSRFLI